MQQKTAIIIGATGLVGNLLLHKLLNDKTYKEIKLFSRRSVEIENPKIKEFLGDIIELEKFETDFTADEVFCCIGTTKAKTKDKKIYKSIDFGIPQKAAKLSKKNNIPFFAIVSALRADKNSSVFYNKTKGEMEEIVLSEKIEKTYILRPSLIFGKRKEKRFGEDIGNAIFKFLSPLMIGKLKKYRPIDAKNIAQTLYKIPTFLPDKNIILSDEIVEIAHTK